MKVATRDQAPEPLVPPQDVVAVQICRLSGKRPAGGCDAVPVVLENGGREERSMVGTEYFVRGTEPEELCNLHVGRSLFSRVTNWFGAPRAQVAEHSGAGREAGADSPSFVPPVSPAQLPAEAGQAPEAPQKKRGFWSKIFGRRDKNDAEKDKDAEKPPAPRKPR